jgi:hypothetical protein
MPFDAMPWALSSARAIQGVQGIVHIDSVDQYSSRSLPPLRLAGRPMGEAMWGWCQIYSAFQVEPH